MDSEIGQLENPILPTTDGTASKTFKMNPLPTKYTVVKPVFLRERSIKLPIDPQIADEEGEESASTNTEIEKATTCEDSWLEVVKKEVEARSQTKNVSWSAFHANRLRHKVIIKGKSGLLPLFAETVESPDMICHTFDLILDATNHLNPGQPPVLACDQPVFAVAKKCQWAFTEKYGEQNIVVMFGGLHIEMTLMKCIGNLVDGSEWDELMADAGVATLGIFISL